MEDIHLQVDEKGSDLNVQMAVLSNSMGFLLKDFGELKSLFKDFDTKFNSALESHRKEFATKEEFNDLNKLVMGLMATTIGAIIVGAINFFIWKR